jgi:hypothetical protein
MRSARRPPDRGPAASPPNPRRPRAAPRRAPDPNGRRPAGDDPREQRSAPCQMGVAAAVAPRTPRDPARVDRARRRVGDPLTVDAVTPRGLLATPHDAARPAPRLRDAHPEREPGVREAPNRPLPWRFGASPVYTVHGSAPPAGGAAAAPQLRVEHPGMGAPGTEARASAAASNTLRRKLPLRRNRLRRWERTSPKLRIRHGTDLSTGDTASGGYKSFSIANTARLGHGTVTSPRSGCVVKTRE